MSFNWQAVQTLTISVSLVNSHRLLICCHRRVSHSTGVMASSFALKQTNLPACLCRAVVPELYFENLHVSIIIFTFHPTCLPVIGADFRFEVPGQSSVGLISGGRGQWLGGTMASAEHEPIIRVWGQKPPEAESILIIGCPTEPANLAPLVKFSK